MLKSEVKGVKNSQEQSKTVKYVKVEQRWVNWSIFAIGQGRSRTIKADQESSG